METRVVDSRVIEDWKVIRRRRECEYCQNRFTTFEKTWITDLIVIKKDWTKEMYDKDKIKRALLLAFAKRNVPIEKFDEIMSTLEVQWSWYWKEIPASKIWEDILQILKKEDIVAYIRFASVYQKFESLEDFKKLVDEGK